MEGNATDDCGLSFVQLFDLSVSLCHLCFLKIEKVMFHSNIK